MIPEQDDRAPVPAPTPERVLWAAQTRALLKVLGPKKAARFLTAMRDDIRAQRDFVDIPRLRQNGPEVRALRHQWSVALEQAQLILLGELGGRRK